MLCSAAGRLTFVKESQPEKTSVPIFVVLAPNATEASDLLFLNNASEQLVSPFGSDTDCSPLPKKAPWPMSACYTSGRHSRQ